MAKEKGKMQSWQVFHFARKHLGRRVLYAIFGKKNGRTVDYWCEDPKYTDKDERAFDPISGVRDLLSALDDHGHTWVVRSCLAYLASDTTISDMAYIPTVTELLPSLAEEELADYQAVAEFQAAIARRDSSLQVSVLKKAAMEEIERTFAKYIEECEK